MFRTDSTNAKLLRCVDQANLILKDAKFYQSISAKASFDMSTADPKYIAGQIKTSKLVCTVKPYYKKWSRAYAYFIASDPLSININTAKLGRSDGSVVATFIHEFVHMVDHADKTHSYGHGSNSPKGKQNTAPYWIDNVAQSLAGDDVDFNNNESSKIVYRKTWRARIASWFRRVF